MRTYKKYTKAQWYDLINKWQASGVSQEKFFEEHHIAKSSFGYWRKKYLREQSASTFPSQMIPVHILPPEHVNPIQQNPNLEIVYPNGVRVVCPAQIDVQKIKDLIR